MNPPTLRYGQFLGAMRRHQRQVSLSEVVALDRQQQGRHRLRLIDFHRLVTPYVWVRFSEQLRTVLPLALLLVAFQALALRVALPGLDIVGLGVLAVMVGLMFFAEGVEHGMVGFAENIGFHLPSRYGPPVVLAFALFLGVAVTFAEPAIGALQAAGQAIAAEHAPYLKDLLGAHAIWLVLGVAAGVGTAVVLGMLRLMFGWKLKTIVLMVVPLCLALSYYCSTLPQLQPVLSLAWDCGAITAGPVTVPLVLAVGVGVASGTERADNPLAGFGIVTLISLFPIVAVLCVSLLLIEQPATLVLPHAGAWYEQTPWVDMIAALRAILPLVSLLLVVQRLGLGQHVRQRNIFVYGVLVAIVGMMLFNVGVSTGLVQLGDQAGANVPWAFSPHRLTGAPALYPYWLGICMTLLFAFVIGYCATIAEPALNSMGNVVENLTDGAFRKRLLIHAAAGGVGAGAMLGVAKVLYDLPMIALLLGLYTLCLVLTALSREEFVNLAWDAAAVTTGPVTVPLLLSLGIGLGSVVGSVEGFGILALCSIGPIIGILGFGLWVDAQMRWKQKGKA
jgi:hypothetical protein